MVVDLVDADALVKTGIHLGLGGVIVAVVVETMDMEIIVTMQSF